MEHRALEGRVDLQYGNLMGAVVDYVREDELDKDMHHYIRTAKIK